MLTPDELLKIPQNIIDLSRRLELELLTDIGERLRLLEPDLKSPTLEWKVKKLREISQYDKYIKSTMNEYTKEGLQEINKLFEEALKISLENDTILFDKTGTKPIYTLGGKEFLNILDTAKTISTDVFTNMSNTMAFDGKEFKKFYIQELDYAHLKLKSGAYSIDDVIRSTARKLRANGLHNVEYKGKRRVNVETAVRRNIMGALNRATDEMSQQNAKALGTDMFEVSAHYNARPSHAIWQGRVYTMARLISVCGFGTGDGLEGWNCRHQKFPFIEGISKRAYTDEEISKLYTPDFTYNGVNYTGYEATQRQRQIESRIRELQRLNAVVQDKDTTKLIKMDIKLYDDFSDKAGLKLQKARFVA